MIESNLLWWGYVHSDGTLHVKRFFDDKDLDCARYSHFVVKIYMPFKAKDRDDAIKQCEMKG